MVVVCVWVLVLSKIDFFISKANEITTKMSNWQHWDCDSKIWGGTMLLSELLLLHVQIQCT